MKGTVRLFISLKFVSVIRIDDSTHNYPLHQFLEEIVLRIYVQFREKEREREKKADFQNFHQRSEFRMFKT